MVSSAATAKPEFRRSSRVAYLNVAGQIAPHVRALGERRQRRSLHIRLRIVPQHLREGLQILEIGECVAAGGGRVGPGRHRLVVALLQMLRDFIHDRVGRRSAPGLAQPFTNDACPFHRGHAGRTPATRSSARTNSCHTERCSASIFRPAGVSR